MTPQCIDIQRVILLENRRCFLASHVRKYFSNPFFVCLLRFVRDNPNVLSVQIHCQVRIRNVQNT